MTRPANPIQVWESDSMYISKIWEHVFYLDLTGDGRETEHRVELYYVEKRSSLNIILKSDDKFMHAYSAHFIDLGGQFNTQLSLPEDGYIEKLRKGWVFDIEKSLGVNKLLQRLHTSNLEVKSGEYKPIITSERNGKDTWKDMMVCLEYVDKLSIEEIYNREGSKGVMVSGNPEDVDQVKVNYGKEMVCLMTATKKISVCVKRSSDDVREPSPDHNGDEDGTD